MAEDPEISAAEVPRKNSPRIGRLIGIDCQPMYFIFIEQKVYVQVSSFALLVWFSSHYVFNLEYHKYYKDAMFMQVYSLSL